MKRLFLFFIFLILPLQLFSAPLHSAAESGNLKKVKEILRIAREFKDIRNEKGETPIHCAIKGGHPDVVKYLVFLKANATVKDNSGCVPLVTLIHANHSLETTSLIFSHLLEGNININSQGPAGEHILIHAAKNLWIDFVAKLANIGAMVNLADEYGNIPLVIASEKDSLKLVKVLVDAGGRVNVADPKGNTPLHYSVKNENQKMARFLLENGALKDARNNNNQSAYDLMGLSENFADYAELVGVIEERSGRGGSVKQITYESKFNKSEPEIMQQPQAPAIPEGYKAAIIDDPDGYTNVRISPRSGTKVVGKVYDGEVFLVKPTESKWWQVKIKGGEVGYMHKSRVKFLR